MKSADTLRMKKLLPGLALFMFSASIQAGDIEGMARITRTLTKKRVVVDAYSPRGGTTANGTAPEDIDEWGRTVVYIDSPLPSGLPAASQLTQQIAQRNRRFEREVLIVQAGSSVSFPNEDPIFHNVFSLSKPKSFDLGYYPKGQTRKVRFDKPGPVQVFCHLHPNMNSAILVVPNMYFTQPASSGEFKITGVPAGRYTLRLWHKSAGYLQEAIEVPAEGAVRVSFLLPLAEAKP